MPPVHTQHKESMLCQTNGVSICPIHLHVPHVWMSPCMFGCPPYVWMPPVCLDASICLDTPHTFGCPLYVLMMFKCPLYIHKTKKACFVRLRGCPYAQYIWMPPYVWMSPCMFGYPSCLDAPICLDTPHMFGCPLYVLMMFKCPLYIHNTKKACFVRLRGCPYAQYNWMAPICLDAPCMFGYPSYV